MGTKGIEKVVIQACSALGIVPLTSIYVPDDFPEGKEERIVIHVKNQQRGEIFYKGFVEVNFVSPDVEGRADHARLEAVEDIFFEAWKYDTVVDYDGETCRYGLASQPQTMPEKEAGYHYVNARLLFEILNV